MLLEYFPAPTNRHLRDYWKKKTNDDGTFVFKSAPWIFFFPVNVLIKKKKKSKPLKTQQLKCPTTISSPAYQYFIESLGWERSSRSSSPITEP